MVDRRLIERAAAYWSDKAAMVQSSSEMRDHAVQSGERPEIIAFLERNIARWEAAPDRTYEEVLAVLVAKYGEADDDRGPVVYDPSWSDS